MKIEHALWITLYVRIICICYNTIIVLFFYYWLFFCAPLIQVCMHRLLRWCAGDTVDADAGRNEIAYTLLYYTRLRRPVTACGDNNIIMMHVPGYIKCYRPVTEAPTPYNNNNNMLLLIWLSVYCVHSAITAVVAERRMQKNTFFFLILGCIALFYNFILWTTKY